MSVISSARRTFREADIASRAAFLSVSSNAALMVLKIAVGLIFGSIAVLGDGIDSAEDLFASGLALFTVRLAQQPADEAHPYGHGKAESLAAMSQAALIAGAAVFIAVAAILRLINGSTELYVLPSLIVMGIAVVVNLGVGAYSMHAARVSGSVAIAADARHLFTNVVQAFAIVIALVLVGITGNHVFDPIMALLLAAYLAWTAIGIFRDALRELIDTALPQETLSAIETCLAHEGHGVRGFHELRTRKSGREMYIDVHVLVDPALSVSEAHQLVEDVQQHLMELVQGAQVTVHIDPDEPEILQRTDGAGSDSGVHIHRH